MSLVFLALKLDIVLVLLFQLDFYFPWRPEPKHRSYASRPIPLFWRIISYVISS
jgi:hypothetical protein